VTDAFRTDVAVRYGDVDAYGHVNNAVYATFCEEARIDYFEHVLGEAGASIGGDGAAAGTETGGAQGVADRMGTVVANLHLDFERPLDRVNTVQVAVAVPRLGEKSFPVEYEITSRAGVHAPGETTMVAFDRTAREPRRIPGPWREPIAAFEDIPPGPTEPP